MQDQQALGRDEDGPQSEAQRAEWSRDRIGRELRDLRPRMTSVARRFAPSVEVAEDIVQNAFEKALRNLDQFQGQARFSTWLHRIVVNEALMWLRSERRRSGRQIELDDWHSAEWIEPAPDPCQRASEQQRREWLLGGLARLPADERDVLLCCGLGEWSYDEFGARRGVQPAAAKSRAFRGRRRLRELLAEA